jgi:hypothetical protein
MLENDAMAAELGYHAAASGALAAANVALRNEAAGLRRGLAAAEATGGCGGEGVAGWVGGGGWEGGGGRGWVYV